MYTERDTSAHALRWCLLKIIKQLLNYRMFFAFAFNAKSFAIANSTFFYLFAFAFNTKSFAIAILDLIFFFLLVTFSGRTVKSFLTKVLRLVIKKACDQDLTHSLDTPRNISVKTFSQVVIRNACGT